MPIQLLAPLYKTSVLERTDIKYGNEGEPSTVTIRQARQHEHERRQELFKRLERNWNSTEDNDSVRLIQEISLVAVWREEAWLTMCECNITGPDGKLLFPSKNGRDGHPELMMSKGAFAEAWGQLFPDIVEEIVEKIHDVNLLWSGVSGEA